MAGVTAGGPAAGTARVPARAAAPDLAPPAVSGRQPALDGLRVIAAFAVLVIHVAGATGFAFNGTPASWITSRGDIGVPIFFTLSGLLLYRPWAAAALSAGDAPATVAYLWRRALRILPAYWAVVVIAILTLNHAHIRSVLSWAQYLLLAQVYDPHPWWSGTGADGLAQMWSLAVEVSFYAVLPLLAGLLTWFAVRAGQDTGRRVRRLLIGIAVLAVLPFGVAVAEFYPSFQPWIGETLPRLMTWFAPGMALAVLAAWTQADARADSGVRRFTSTIAQSGGLCWLIAGMVFILACTPVTGPETIGYVPLWPTEIKLALYAIVAVAVVAPAAFQPSGMTRMSVLLGNRVMRFLGKISYGIFLWQYVVLFAVFAGWHLRDIFHGGSFTLFSATYLLIAITVATVIAATLSYYVIEQPAQRLMRLTRSRQSGRHRVQPSEAQPADVRSAAAEALPAERLIPYRKNP
jgi:peptidoglycan/LPS O-acetylase OafA/YrhL